MDQYVASTVDISVKDPTTENIIAISRTLMNAGLTQSVQSQDIYGGKGAELQYTYNYQKKLDVTVEDCEWKPEYIALNNGWTSISNDAVTAQMDGEDITLDGSGVGTVSQTPTSTYVTLENSSGTKAQVTPATKTVTYLAFASQTVKAYYDYSSAGTDYITIDANKFPGTYILTMSADLFDKDNGQIKIGTVQIRINRFKMNGDQTFTFDMQNPFTSGFSGTALKDSSGNYATIAIIRDSTDVNSDIVDLYLYPDSDTMDISDGDILTIVAKGDRGSGLDSVISPSGVTFASDDEAVATVGESTGVITTVSAGTCTITGSLTVGSDTLTGICNLTVTD